MFLSQGGDAGRKPDVVFFTGFLRSAWECFPARVLPAFPGVVPMETKLREVTPYPFGRWFGKGNPNPFANYFGKLVLLGHPAAEFFEDLLNGKFPVEIAFGKIDVRLNRVRSWEFGVRS